MITVYPIWPNGSFGYEGTELAGEYTAGAAAREHVRRHGIPKSGKVCVVSERPRHAPHHFILNVEQPDPQVIVTDQRGNEV